MKKKLVLGIFLSSIAFLQAQDQATNYNNVSLSGWLLVNNSGTSSGKDNGIFFGTSYAWDAPVGIFSNKSATGNGPKDGLNFMTDESLRMVISKKGNVGIGTLNPKSLLSVKGTILTKDVEISTRSEDWPDYVFEEDYKLPSLESLKKYLKNNKHLPYLTSKDEIDCTGTYNLNKTTVNMLKTIEELTLHIIELNEKVKKLEEGVNKKAQ